jgi:dihydroxyacetone kinase
MSRGFSAMRSAGLAIKNKESIDLKDLSVMFDEAIKAIIKTGKASVGQKTILDTFIPTFKFFLAINHGPFSGSGLCSSP